MRSFVLSSIALVVVAAAPAFAGEPSTASGKAKHRQAGTSHLASRKTKKTRRNLRGTRVVSKTVLKQITRALAGHSS